MRPWTSQLKKGLVELAILAALRDGEAYGYQLLQRINLDEKFSLTESTVYPLLARLTKEKLLSVRVGPSPNGPPRRYYQLTAAGQTRLNEMVQEWQQLNNSINQLLNGKNP